MALPWMPSCFWASVSFPCISSHTDCASPTVPTKFASEMAGALPLSRSAFSYAASLGSSLDESGADDSIEEADSDDVVDVLMLCTTGVVASMGVLAVP